ncbi:MAG: rhomboid family intramembrane serine protease [Pseudomonadota bacterium]
MAQNPTGLALPRLTPAVKVILITNVAVFVLLGLLVKIAPGFYVILFDNLALSPSAIVDFKVWTLLTYAFVHSLQDVFHLLFNLLLLFFFGPALEQRWGTRRFVIFYAMGALGGAALFLAFNVLVGNEARVVGASGAVLAALVAWGLIYPNIPVYFFGILPLRGKHLILITIGIELLMAVSQTPVSSATHFGGMAVGALLVTGYWRPRALFEKLQLARKKVRRPRSPKFTVVINPDDDDRAPPGGWVH